MATHIHLHIGPFGAKITDAAPFNESQHKRQGGQFATTGSAGGAATAAHGRAAFAAKHNPAAKAKAAAAEESTQEKLDRARREQPLL